MQRRYSRTSDKPGDRAQDKPTETPEEQRFIRFAAAMREARANAAPELDLYLDQAPDPPAVPPRAALRWLGVGSCVLLVCVVILGLLAWPQTVQLFDRWLAAWPSAQVHQAPSALPAPAPQAQAAVASRPEAA